MEYIMDHCHHKPIKRFGLDGIIHDESAIGRLKNEYIKLLVTEMKLSGYVPRLDIDPDFTISYNETTRSFEFELSLHGVYIGRKQAKWILGLDGTKIIYSPKSRSDVFSQDLA